MEKIFNTRYVLLLLLLAGLMLTACSSSDVTESSPTEPAVSNTPEAVAFNSYLQRSASSTRATYPTSAPVGQLDDAELQASSFAVFAQYTGDTEWGDYTKTTPFNFMWHQKVDYDTDHWTYSPVKYWPNDNQPADGNGATGSQSRSYLNFFGYAPYVDTAVGGFNVKDTDSNSDGIKDHDGIVKVTGNGTSIDDSSVYYRTSLSSPFSATESVDLLWAARRDLFKTDDAGYGYVDGKVNLVFKHALSLFTITVQGLFDHANNDDKTTTYPDDRDMYTHILIDQVDFDNSPLFKEGTMYIAPQPATADVPHWEVTDTRQKITIDGLDINPTLRNSYLDGTVKKYWDDDDDGEATTSNLKSFLQLSDQDDDGDEDADDALALFNQLPKGVSHEEVALSDQDEHYYMVLPNKEWCDAPANSSDKMKVHIVYYVITYDPRLELVKTGYPKYFSIVKNDITATFDSFVLEPNKKYKLRLQPGVTSAKFEVTMVDGWDTPLTLTPEVVDWYETPIELDVQ